MKKNTVITFLVLSLIFAVLLSSCATKSSNTTADLYKKETPANTNQVKETVKATDETNKMAYNFELRDFDGNIHKLSDYLGKKVYIKFWGTWCPVCVSGLGELSQLSDQYKDSTDVVIITIVGPGISGELSEDKFKAWYKERGYSFTVLFDSRADSFIEYGIRAFPTSAFVASDGTLYDVQIGDHSNESINKTLSSMK